MKRSKIISLFCALTSMASLSGFAAPPVTFTPTGGGGAVILAMPKGTVGISTIRKRSTLSGGTPGYGVPAYGAAGWDGSGQVYQEAEGLGWSAGQNFTGTVPTGWTRGSVYNGSYTPVQTVSQYDPYGMQGTIQNQAGLYGYTLPTVPAYGTYGWGGHGSLYSGATNAGWTPGYNYNGATPSGTYGWSQGGFRRQASIDIGGHIRLYDALREVDKLNYYYN